MPLCWNCRPPLICRSVGFQRPAIRGRKRCRLHGGLSPGAPRGPKNGNFKTGDWTSEAINERKWPWILEPGATGLCEPDLHVFAKLFEDRLERGLEAQALSGREIGGDDDVLNFFVGYLVDIDL